MNHKSKLDIGDADLHLVDDQERGLKQLIVSYKCININTYNIVIMDLKTRQIK